MSSNTNDDINVLVKREIDSFESLLEERLSNEGREGPLIMGTVVDLNRHVVVVDVGLKSECRIPKSEFSKDTIEIGSKIEVMLEDHENSSGSTVLSREKARAELAWKQFEKLYEQNIDVSGKIIGRVKGGFAVELGDIIAFLPGSQVDIRPIKDASDLFDIEQPFKILKMDKDQGNVVVSRRAILEESRAEERDNLLSSIKEGSILKGAVKNITDYGVFVDLGPIDGLLHITDISWSKISHPSEVLSVGQELEVIVVRYNYDIKRISLGLKQLQQNPWENIAEKYAAGTKHGGKVSSIVEYGVFVELEPGVEGLVYHTEMNWNNRNTHPKKLVSVGQEFEVVVLDFNIDKHRISLSIKQAQENPWKIYIGNNPVGTRVTGIIQHIADFGIFVQLKNENPPCSIDALIPAVELSWDSPAEAELKKYSKGDEINGIILTSDIDRERVTIGVKQLSSPGVVTAKGKYKKGKVVTCVVDKIESDGIYVTLGEGDGLMRVLVKNRDLSKHYSEQNSSRFGVGEKVDAKVVAVNNFGVILSIKDLEIEREKHAITEYGSKDSGASLGDILGDALGAISTQSVTTPASTPASNVDESPKKSASIKKEAAKKEEAVAKKDSAKKEAAKKDSE